MDTPKKLKRELPYDPEVPLLGINPEKMKVLVLNGARNPILIVPLFIILKTWKQPEHHQQMNG